VQKNIIAAIKKGEITTNMEMTTTNSENEQSKNKSQVGRTSRKFPPRKSSQIITGIEDDEDEKTLKRQPESDFAGFSAKNTLNDLQHQALSRLIDPKDMGRGTHVKKYVLLITGNASDALTLAQVMYWIDSNGKNPSWKRNIPCKWTALTSKELGQQLCRTENEIEKSLKRLQKAGFVEWRTKLFGGSRKRHIWINWDQIANAYKNAKEEIAQN